MVEWRKLKDLKTNEICYAVDGRVLGPSDDLLPIALDLIKTFGIRREDLAGDGARKLADRLQAEGKVMVVNNGIIVDGDFEDLFRNLAGDDRFWAGESVCWWATIIDVNGKVERFLAASEEEALTVLKEKITAWNHEDDEILVNAMRSGNKEDIRLAVWNRNMSINDVSMYLLEVHYDENKVIKHDPSDAWFEAVGWTKVELPPCARKEEK